MARRGRSKGHEPTPRRFPAEGATCATESVIASDVDEARLALKALAEYFAILREWSLKRRVESTDASPITHEL
jgi:hypothetical protein